MMNKVLFYIFLLIINPFSIFGQSLLKIKDADIIDYNTRTVKFYSLKNNNLFRILLNEDEENGFIKFSADSENTSYQPNELPDAANFVKKKDIEKFDFEKSFENIKFEIIEGEDKWLFSKFNNHIVMIEYYRYEEFNNVLLEKRTFNWNLRQINFYNLYFIDIGDNKKILMIDNSNGCIIPTKKQLIVKIDGHDFSYAKIIKNCTDSLQLTLNYFCSNKYYFKHRESNDKWSLRNKFGEIVIPTLYDSIYLNDRFIIGISKNKYQIFNTRLDKLLDNNIRAAYSFGLRMQLLQGNKIRIIDVQNKDADFYSENYWVCGTENYYTYSIIKDTLTVNIDKRFTEGVEFINKYSISTHNFDSICFLNKSNKISFDDNSILSFYDEKQLCPYQWLIVSKNNKLGIFEFSTRKNEVELKKILQIEYDSIESYGLNLPVKLKKNGMYKYFLVNNSEYKNLERFNQYFCRYAKKNGQEGWLDLKGNEYPDK